MQLRLLRSDGFLVSKRNYRPWAWHHRIHQGSSCSESDAVWTSQILLWQSTVTVVRSLNCPIFTIQSCHATRNWHHNHTGICIRAGDERQSAAHDHCTCCQSRMRALQIRLLVKSGKRLETGQEGKTARTHPCQSGGARVMSHRRGKCR